MCNTCQVSPGVWNHVCWVFNGSDLVLYINKIAQASVTATGKIEFD